MVDLNQIVNWQGFSRENMLAPNSFDTVVDLRGKYSTFMMGGEVTTVMTPPTTFVWVPASTDVDDGLSTVKPSNLLAANPGRWKAIAAIGLEATAAAQVIGTIAAGDSAKVNVTVTGAVQGDYAIGAIVPGPASSKLTMSAYVSAADTVTVVLANASAGGIAVGTVDVKARVLR